MLPATSQLSSKAISSNLSRISPRHLFCRSAISRSFSDFSPTVGNLHLLRKLDVKNEARIHLWYEECFGYAIKPYISSADAIATFPTTATAVGVRRIHGKFECCAPFGLDDLFGLVVRPNKRQITRDIYEAKVDRWRSIWPRLIFLPWEEILPPVR